MVRIQTDRESQVRSEGRQKLPHKFGGMSRTSSGMTQALLACQAWAYIHERYPSLLFHCSPLWPHCIALRYHSHHSPQCQSARPPRPLPPPPPLPAPPSLPRKPSTSFPHSTRSSPASSSHTRTSNRLRSRHPPPTRPSTSRPKMSPPRPRVLGRRSRRRGRR